jgi:DNA-nicking Smr family endonuclease
MLYREILLFLTCMLAYCLLLACIFIRFMLNIYCGNLYREQSGHQATFVALPVEHKIEASHGREASRNNRKLVRVDLCETAFNFTTRTVQKDATHEPLKNAVESSNGVLSPEDKQQIYDEVRYPINSLKKELASLKRQLHQTLKTSVKHRKLTGEIREIEAKIEVEEKKAAREVFAQLNSASDMGEGKFDFHGLHIHEAKKIARVTIVPKLATMHEIIIVTGHGKNRANGKSKLKEEIQMYFVHELRLNCESVAGNEGALRVSKKNSVVNSDNGCFASFSSPFERAN